jgi:hypothetical protein
MVFSGRAVKYDPKDRAVAALPDDYLAQAGDITTPVLLITGADNHVFTNSNVVCFKKLEAVAPGRHRLQVIPGYGHQDVFMGKAVDQDVFPSLVRFMTAHADGVPEVRTGATVLH